MGIVMEGEDGVEVPLESLTHTHDECLWPNGQPLVHFHGTDPGDHTHPVIPSWGEAIPIPYRAHRPHQVVVPVAGFEYRCAACNEPILEPEYESPFRLLAVDGDAPNITDYGEDFYAKVEGLPERMKGGVKVPLDVIVHPEDCWHWCADDEVQRVGKAQDCPVKDSHSEE